MMLRSLNGDDEINAALMAVMNQTIHSLAVEGIITATQKEEFLDTHICMLASSDGPFTKWLKRFFRGVSTDKGMSQVIVMCPPRSNKNAAN